jgi:hypothetical protein
MAGKELRKDVEQWFGQSTAAGVLVRRCGFRCRLNVHISSDPGLVQRFADASVASRSFIFRTDIGINPPHKSPLPR